MPLVLPPTLPGVVPLDVAIQAFVDVVEIPELVVPGYIADAFPTISHDYDGALPFIDHKYAVQGTEFDPGTLFQGRPTELSPIVQGEEIWIDYVFIRLHLQEVDPDPSGAQDIEMLRERYRQVIPAAFNMHYTLAPPGGSQLVTHVGITDVFPVTFKTKASKNDGLIFVAQIKNEVTLDYHW